MLECVLNDAIYDEEESVVRFQSPPLNIMRYVWKSKEQLLLYLHFKAYEVGYFEGRMFSCRRLSNPNQTYLQCKFCPAKIHLESVQGGVIVKSIHNLHQHHLTQLPNNYINIFRQLQNQPISELIDSIQQRFQINKIQSRIIQNTYYQRFVNFEQIVGKVVKEHQTYIKVWKDEKDMPYMILLVTPTMKQSYLKYGQSMSYDSIHKLNELRRSRFYGKFWITSTFGGLDSNNRFLLFGIVMTVHNSNLYYKRSATTYNLFEQFFRAMGSVICHTIITNDSQRHEEGLLRLKVNKHMNWVHLFGWSYKLRTLMSQMHSKGYKRDEIKRAINLYSNLLKENDQQAFKNTVLSLIDNCKEKEILYKFLGKMEKYCFICLPNVYCGFGFTTSRMQSYSKMSHFFLQRHNFYAHFNTILGYEEVLLKPTRKVHLSSRNKCIGLDQQLKKLTFHLQKNIGIFRKPQPYKTSCIETAIYKKIIENYNQQRQYSLKILNKNSYAIYSQQQSIAQVIYVQCDQIWHCSCMYQFKIGIPCPHLIKVFSVEKVNIIQYFHNRWLRYQQQSKSAAQKLSRKKRRHD